MATLSSSAASSKKTKSEIFIKSLKIKRSTSALLKRVAQDVCPVCLEDFGVNQKVCLVSCNHMFHENCIVQWLRQKNTCPLCRCKLYNNEDPLIVNAQQTRIRSTVPRMSVRATFNMNNFRMWYSVSFYAPEFNSMSIILCLSCAPSRHI